MPISPGSISRVVCIVIFAYFSRLSGHVAAFMDRVQAVYHGKELNRKILNNYKRGCRICTYKIGWL